MEERQGMSWELGYKEEPWYALGYGEPGYEGEHSCSGRAVNQERSSS